MYYRSANSTSENEQEKKSDVLGTLFFFPAHLQMHLEHACHAHASLAHPVIILSSKMHTSTKIDTINAYNLEDLEAIGGPGHLCCVFGQMYYLFAIPRGEGSLSVSWNS